MSSHQHYHQQTASVDGSVISHEEFPTTHTHTHTLSLSLSLSLSLLFSSLRGIFTGRKYALIELLWNTEILIGGFWLLLLKGFAVPVVGIMPYFGGGLTEKRWAFNRMEEAVLPKVGIMTNRENGIFPFWLSPFFLEQRKGLLFFGGYLYLENMLLKSKI